MDMNIDAILKKAEGGGLLNKSEAVALLETGTGSADFHKIIALADKMTRTEYNLRGYVFAQIGLNAEPCSIDCKFCSMGKSHYAMDGVWRKRPDEVLKEAKDLLESGIDDLFVMTTADYPVSDFIEISTQIKSIMPEGVRFVANIGDFSEAIASKLKAAGFTGVYHIKRLREGTDTNVSPETRIRTLDAVRNAGLELYYCVEPIGPEHSYDEIADEMIRARDYDVKVMAVMRRIPVPGTPLFDLGQITAVELAKIAAVARLVTRPSRAMNAHETISVSLICGVNQLYAEVGANPRDNISNTENNRGLSTEDIKVMLRDAGYKV